MPFDYDIEFAAAVRNPDTAMEGGIYFDDTYEQDGITEEIVQKLREEKGVDRVTAYKENNKIKILLKEEQMDPYLDASDFRDDGQYRPMGGNEEIKSVFGDEDSILAQAKIVGYQQEELESFVPYIVEGRLDMEKLNSGEEVILVAPPFTLTVQEDGGIRKDWKAYGTKDAYANAALHAGDEITVAELKSRVPYNGSVNRETLERDYVCRTQKVKIGAVLGSFTGWFENEASMGESYYLYTTSEAFAHLGMDVTYNRVRIFTENGIDYEEAAERIKGYSAEFPYIHVQDLHKELETYHKLKQMLELFCHVLTIMAGAAVLFCVSSQFLFKTKINAKKYMLLRVCGLSVGKLEEMVIFQVMLLGGLGILLSAPCTFLLVYVFLGLGTEEIRQFLFTPESAAVLLLLLPCLAASAMPSIAYIHRVRIKDIL